MRFPEVSLSLPGWVEELVEPGATFPTVEDRMGFVIELSQLNVRHGGGGPFGAAVFDRETGELLAPGVNLVTSANCSVAHAEMVAIMVAQQSLGDFDLTAVLIRVDPVARSQRGRTSPPRLRALP